MIPEPGQLVIFQGQGCARELELKRTCGGAILIGMLKNKGLAGTILSGFNLSYELMQTAFHELDPDRQKERGGKARLLEAAETAVKNARLAAQKLGQNLDSAHILLSLLTSKLGSKKIRALLEKSGVEPDEVINRTLNALSITKTQWDAAMPSQ